MACELYCYAYLVEKKKIKQGKRISSLTVLSELREVNLLGRRTRAPPAEPTPTLLSAESRSSAAESNSKTAESIFTAQI